MPETFGMAYGQAAYLKKQQADYYQQLLAEAQAAFPEGGYGEMEPFGPAPNADFPQGVASNDPGLTSDRFRAAVQENARQQAVVQPGRQRDADLFGNPTAIRSQLAYGQEPSIPAAYGEQTFDQSAADQALIEGYQAGKGLSNYDFDRLFTTLPGSPDTTSTEFTTPQGQRSLAGDRSVSKVTNAKVTSVPGTPGSVVPRSSSATPDAMQGEPAPAWNQYLSDVRGTMFSEQQKEAAKKEAAPAESQKEAPRRSGMVDPIDFGPEERAEFRKYQDEVMASRKEGKPIGSFEEFKERNPRPAAPILGTVPYTGPMMQFQALAGNAPTNTARNDELRRSLLAQSRPLGLGMHT